MQLYRVQVFNDPTKRTPRIATSFHTSSVKARRKARSAAKHEHCERVELDRCDVQQKLSVQDWIDLLESDSPGMTMTKTPVDFITHIEPIGTIEGAAK